MLVIFGSPYRKEGRARHTAMLYSVLNNPEYIITALREVRWIHPEGFWHTDTTYTYENVRVKHNLFINHKNKLAKQQKLCNMFKLHSLSCKANTPIGFSIGIYRTLSDRFTSLEVFF